MNEKETKKAQMLATIKAARLDTYEAQGAAIRFESEDLGALVLFRHNLPTESVTIVAFSGRKTKPEIYVRFRNISYAEKYFQGWRDRLIERAQAKMLRKAEKAAKRAEGHGLIVGDVLSCSWGYEQTNMEYFQVTRLVGKCSVEVREIGQDIEETGHMRGLCTPLRNAFIGEPKVYRVDEYGSIKTRSFGAYASKKEGLKVAGMEFLRLIFIRAMPNG